MNKKFFEMDWTEELCILSLVALAVLTGLSSAPKDTSIFTLPVATGILGYLKGKKSVAS